MNTLYRFIYGAFWVSPSIKDCSLSLLFYCQTIKLCMMVITDGLKADETFGYQRIFHEIILKTFSFIGSQRLPHCFCLIY